MSEQERSVRDQCDPHTLLILEKIDHIADRQTEHSQALEDLRIDMTDMKVAVGKLEVKSGIWGAVAGAFTAAIAVLSKKLAGV